MSGLQDLTYWSIARLQALESELLLQLTCRARGHLTRARLLLGRCMVALDRTGAAEQYGCSGSVHYLHSLGVDPRVARESRRVAERLEDLPLLREAAERGRIDWSVIREITSKATPETEGRWLELALRCSYKTIERLVVRTELGRLPDEPNQGPDRDPEYVEIRTRIDMDVNAMLVRVTRELSQQAQRGLGFGEVLTLLLAEHLAGTGHLSPASLGRVLGEARRDAAASQQAERSVLGSALRAQGHGSQTVTEPTSPGAGDPRGSNPTCEKPAPEPDEPPASETEASPAPSPGKPSSATSSADARCPDPRGSTGEPEPPAAPWAAVAANEESCPGESQLQIVRPASPPWENSRLRFSGTARSSTPGQRREILRRHGYCCATPGCPHSIWLHVHHIVFYCQGGTTIPENMLALCSKCHRNLHRGWLRVNGQAPDALRWRNQWGDDLSQPPPIPPD